MKKLILLLTSVALAVTYPHKYLLYKTGPNSAVNLTDFDSAYRVQAPLTISNDTIKLGSSGVVAGTYGDATHVGQFTVNGAGIITNATNITISGGGTVTSVGLSMPPSVFTTTGSPIVGAGTFNVSLNAQADHTVLAAPVGGGTPSFRAILPGDISFLTDSLTAERSYALLRIHDSMLAERSFDTLTSRGISHDTGNAIRSYVAGAFQPLENQRLSTTNSPTFAGINGSTIYLNGTTEAGLAYQGSYRAVATSMGVQISPSLIVPSLANNSFLATDATGKFVGKAISISDLPGLSSVYLPLSAGSSAPLTGALYGNGMIQRVLVGSTTAAAIYGDGVVPSQYNYGILSYRDGSSTWINGSAKAGIDIASADILTATSSGVSVVGGLSVSGITNAAYLGADANGKLTAKTIAASDLPASIQTAQSIPVDRVAIGNGSSGLSSDSGLQLLRKTTDPYSGYQLQAGKATMGTWSSDATMAWFGAVGENNSYNNHYGIATDGTTTIVGAVTSVKLRAANGDGLTVSYQQAGNAGAIASGNFQRTWRISVTTLPNTSGLPVGFEVHALYPMAPSGATVSVYNPRTERIRFRDRSTNAITTDSTTVFVGQAVDFIFLGTYLGTAFWSANSI